MYSSWLDQQVDRLCTAHQYTMAQGEKEADLLPIFKERCHQMSEVCAGYGRFVRCLGRPVEEWQGLADIPPLPVSMFKQFELRAVPRESIVRELRSSSTTGQSPSRIFVDKPTAFRQARALAGVLAEHIGRQRRPFLVLDSPHAVAEGSELTARGAAIRGIASFASETTFAMRGARDGDVIPDFHAITNCLAANRDRPILIFGFTFIIWTRFVMEAERQGIRFDVPQAQVLHSGGWKKLTAQAVSKDVFTGGTSAVLGCRPEAILDFYGMIEQVGTVFVDCESGSKHAPAFADVIIRQPFSLAPVKPGEEGIIEVLSVLPSSYPGQALLTEDQGRLLGVDDCPCGRKGRYFRFTSRVERTEVRGCGDTFGQARERP